MKCYTCEKGNLKRSSAPFESYGVKLGKFQAETCSTCGEVFFSEDSSNAIDNAAKKAGIFGLEGKTHIGQMGNALGVTLPKKLAAFAKFEKGTGGGIYPDGPNRLVIKRFLREGK